MLLIWLIIPLLMLFYKYFRENKRIIEDLKKIQLQSQQLMILHSQFTYFSVESFILCIIPAMTFNDYELSTIILFFIGHYLFCIFLYGFVVRKYEKATGLNLWGDVQKKNLNDLKISMGIFLIPICFYQLLGETFLSDVDADWGGWWFVGVVLNYLFLSVMTIVFTVVLILRLIPNREIVEPEYLEIINKRLKQVGLESLRLRWIETDLKNAFVVGFKLPGFANQTLMIGRGLRDALTPEEFDAVVCHELGHIVNKHTINRLIYMAVTYIALLFIISCIFFLVPMILQIIFGIDVLLNTSNYTSYISIPVVLSIFGCNWFIFRKSRHHEFEADGFAVITLGASLEAWKSSLAKLMSQDDLPDYVKEKREKNKKSILPKKMSSFFSTHPEFSQRLSSLEDKLKFNRSFNYMKERASFIELLQWKYVLSTFGVVLSLLIIVKNRVNEDREFISKLSKLTPQEIASNDKILEEIRHKKLIYPSLPAHYFVMKKNDDSLTEKLIDKKIVKASHVLYFLARQKKDEGKFEYFFKKYQSRLSKDEVIYFIRVTKADSKSRNLVLESKVAHNYGLKFSQSKRQPASVKSE